MKYVMQKGLIEAGTPENLIKATECVFEKINSSISDIAKEFNVTIDVMASNDEETGCQYTVMTSDDNIIFTYTFFTRGWQEGLVSTHTTEFRKQKE